VLCSLLFGFLFVDVNDIASVFFFFQAEDGIRYRNVTGVQTCALPIFRLARAIPIGGVEAAIIASTRPSFRDSVRSLTANQTMFTILRSVEPRSSTTPNLRTMTLSDRKSVV